MKKGLPIIALVLCIAFSACQMGNTANNSDVSQISSEITDTQTAHYDEHSTNDNLLTETETYMDKLMSVDPLSENDFLGGRFIDIWGDEKANVLGDGKAFALLSNDEESWNVVYTQNGGKDWIQSGNYVGHPDCFAILENGMILSFSYDDSAERCVSDVQVLKFNEETKNIESNSIENWFDIFEFKDNLSYRIGKVHYIGNNMLYTEIYEIPDTYDEAVSHWDSYWNRVYTGSVTLDSETLIPVKFTDIETDRHRIEQKAEENKKENTNVSVATAEDNDNLSYEQKICTIDPWSVFINYPGYITNEEVTFLDLFIKGRANVISPGKAFAITCPQGIGMSKTVAEVYYTADGGKNWEHIDSRFEVNSGFDSIPLDNGKILYFLNPGVISRLTPIVTLLSFDTQEKSLVEEELSNWFDVFNIEREIYISEITCFSNDDDSLYKAKINLKSSDYGESYELFDGYVFIDKETLQPTKIEK